MAGRPSNKAKENVSIDKIEENMTVETEEKNKVTEKEKKVFTDSDYIMCHSVWAGGLNVNCQSGNAYEFAGYGSECEINYRDLVALIRKHSEHIFLPRFIIDDEDFLDDFQNVKKVYESMYTHSDLMEIINLPNNQMRREIENLPVAVKNTMRNLISTEIASGKIDSIRKVRALTEIFNSDFNLMSELFSK